MLSSFRFTLIKQSICQTWLCFNGIEHNLIVTHTCKKLYERITIGQSMAFSLARLGLQWNVSIQNWSGEKEWKQIWRHYMCVILDAFIENCRGKKTHMSTIQRRWKKNRVRFSMMKIWISSKFDYIFEPFEKISLVFCWNHHTWNRNLWKNYLRMDEQ